MSKEGVLDVYVHVKEGYVMKDLKQNQDYLFSFNFLFYVELQLIKASLGGSVSKESAGNARDPDSISGLGRSPGEENSYPLQYFCLENTMDRSLEGYSPWGHKELDTTE